MGGGEEAGEDFQEGRFATAGGADEGDEGIWGEIEREVFDGAQAAGVGDGEIVHMDEWGRDGR